MERGILNDLGELARLRLSGECAERLTRELRRVLEQFGRLEELALPKDESSPHPESFRAPLRPDAPRPSPSIPSDALLQRPLVDGHLPVPRILD